MKERLDKMYEDERRKREMKFREDYKDELVVIPADELTIDLKEIEMKIKH